jgi:hypothetical protein
LLGSNDTSEGISVAIGGLRASTKYVVGGVFKRTTGTLTVTTAGGLAASNPYQDLSLPFGSGFGFSLKTFNGIVQSDASASDITVQLTVDSGGSFNIYEVWMYELGVAGPYEAPHLPMQTGDYTTSDDTATFTADTWSNISDFTLSQYIPNEGYRLIYEVTLSYGTEASLLNDGILEALVRIQEDVDEAGSPSTVEGPYSLRDSADTGSDSARVGGTVTVKFIRENPTPGSSYEYTFDVYYDDSGDHFDDFTGNPTVASIATVSRARLYFERI